MAIDGTLCDMAAIKGRPSSIPTNLTVGMRIADRYRLVRKIGAGAMGEVWAAVHESLDEEVALKLIVRDVTHEDGSSADSRFLLEARVAAQLSRKTRHIVSVSDHGEDGPYAYLVMPLLDGESLDERLERTGPLPLSKVASLVYQIARALSVAHADGVVHRDLKPSNVFVTVDEEGKALLKILDFGIAKLRPGARRRPGEQDVSKHATLTGFLLGTPSFMSPEQARGKTVDHRADVWALAVIAYHLLTGQLPFDGETVEALLVRLCQCRFEPISTYRPDLGAAADEVFARAFAERIDRRFPSAVAFAGALEQLELLRQCSNSSPRPMEAISLPPAHGDVAPVSLEPSSPQRLGAEAEAEAGAAAEAGRRARRSREAATRSVSDATLDAAGIPARRSNSPALIAGGALALGVAVVLLRFVPSTNHAESPRHEAGRVSKVASSPHANEPAGSKGVPLGDLPDDSDAVQAMNVTAMPRAPSARAWDVSSESESEIPRARSSSAMLPSPAVVRPASLSDQAMPGDPSSVSFSTMASPPSKPLPASISAPSRLIDRSEIF